MLRIGSTVAPTLVALATVLFLLRVIPEAKTKAGGVGWIVAIAGVAFAVTSATSRFTVKLLPLAALMRLSLVFPDQAPSRLKLAIRASSRKGLSDEVESARHHGLSSDATEAAGQLLLLTSALGEHDRRTRGHSERVRLYARLLGEEMGLVGEDLERLQWGALLHDVGKLTIPSEILNKPDDLDQTEWAIMAGHAAAGGELTAPLHPFLGRFVQAADGHHERWDGSGYPLGLEGEAIPLAARIVAVADAYEVMTATRTYKRPMSSQAARTELTACAGTHFDPNVVRAWLRVPVGDVNRAAGPVAMLAGLPLIGQLAALFARAASRISTIPGAVATIAPAAATASAMAIAVTAGQPFPTAPNRIAFDVPTTIQSTTTVPTTVTPTTVAPKAVTRIATAPSPGAPGEITRTTGSQLTIHGPITSGADLSSTGLYDNGTHVFRDGPQLLASHLSIGATTITAGTTVCVDLFVNFGSAGEETWWIDYNRTVLAVTGPTQELADTDFLSAPGVDYGPGGQRGLGNNDSALIRRNGTTVRLSLKDGNVDQVRILIDCGS